MLRVEGVSKAFRYRPQLAGSGSLKSALLSLARGRRTPRVVVEALCDVSFVIEPGQSLGIVGKNGAGKSTLLRLVAGAYRPDQGRVAVDGRVGRLLELGAGFHPELSGAENAEIAALVAGLSRAEYRELRPEIEAFCELGEFWAAPLRTYSNGMLLRLGFAVATAIRPRLLVVDEVLAVGDAGFQAKCRERIASLREGGTALLVASHSVDELKRCGRVLWLDAGRVRELGEPQAVVRAYHETLL